MSTPRFIILLQRAKEPLKKVSFYVTYKNVCLLPIISRTIKLKAAEAKLQEAENSQILADVGALNLSPEQLAEFLKLATSGKLNSAGTSNSYGNTVANTDHDTDIDDEREDFDDEEN